MNICELQTRTPEQLAPLVDVWERSVRATHHFLSESEIQRIKAYVPQALAEAEHLAVEEETPGAPLGFLGVNGNRLEMLFLDPAARGKGLGRKLIQYGIDAFHIQEVTVNEQNPQAVDFYQHLGFVTYRRTDRDEEGGPYPLLYMKRENH